MKIEEEGKGEKRKDGVLISTDAADAARMKRKYYLGFFSFCLLNKLYLYSFLYCKIRNFLK